MALLGWQNIAIWRPKNKIEPRSNGHEYALGYVLEGTMQCVKSFRTSIDIGKDIGILHISEVCHVHVKNMNVMFIVGGKMKASLN
jgi:predicted RNA-binding protein with RPS1 domain